MPVLTLKGAYAEVAAGDRYQKYLEGRKMGRRKAGDGLKTDFYD
jgi:hypothetical protein